MTNNFFTARNLKKFYPLRAGPLRKAGGWVRAVDGVDVTFHRGEILGLVGESGCGKSTLARALLGLETPTEGEILFDGKRMSGFSSREWKEFRRRVQPIFQDPFGSLNPRMRIGEIVAEPLLVHRLSRGGELQRQAGMLLEQVGLEASAFRRYPHEFSGGQRQRIGIARALATKPEVLICDEPVSSLDLSVQAQVLNVLLRLQRQYRLTYLLITHDLSLLEALAERVMVMYLGKIVEIAPTQILFSTPAHPYTQMLLEAVPRFGKPRPTREAWEKGEIPSAARIPSGCRFRTRCPYAEKRCEEEEPILTPHPPRPPSQIAACHFSSKLE